LWDNQEDTMLSVMTLNLRFGLADDGPNSWEYRKKALTSLFAEYPADFIGFQEANDFQIKFLKTVLPEHNIIGKRKPAPYFWQNNIIFYKNTWESVFYEHFFLSPTPTIPSRSRKSKWPRQCTMGIFKKNGLELICINTHFDFDASVQAESAGIIMDRLFNMPQKTPAILLGDFNTTPNSSSYKMFTGHDQNIRPTKLDQNIRPAKLDQNIRPKKLYFQNVFKNHYPGTHHGFTGNQNGGHIDWILYRGRLEVKDKRVITDSFNKIYPSDHFPVYATFKWQ